MKKLFQITCFAGLALNLAANPASAAEATRVWGAGNNIHKQLTDSATFHNLNGLVASQAASAKWGGAGISINNTSCGNCTYYSINGDNNDITDNTTHSTNSGSVTANGQWDDTYSEFLH
jgi:hypothetical protein